MTAYHRPLLAAHARYRWDRIREQHQVVFPEGILVLNETAAAIVQLCDGRTMAELLTALAARFEASASGMLGEEVVAFLDRLSQKGLLRDAADS